MWRQIIRQNGQNSDGPGDSIVVVAIRAAI
jgi:hypothetical protein